MSGAEIIVEQNSPRSLERLAAVSAFYGHGKLALGGQMTLTVGIAVVLSVLCTIFPSFKLWATFISVTIVWLDVLVIDRIQMHCRKLGAKAQELFDCELFELDWNAMRVGEKLEPEAIHRAAADFRTKRNDDKLRDWYPSAVAELPLPIARLLCQRACFWWDTTQRRKYGYVLVAFVVVALLAMVAAAVCRSQSVGDMILSVYAPFAPAMIWSIREAFRQKDAADGLEKNRGHVEKIWVQAINGELSKAQLARLSRQIQDALFDGRSRNPLVFNWIYSRLRSANEQAMAQAAASMVQDALSKRAKWEGNLQ